MPGREVRARSLCSYRSSLLRNPMYRGGGIMTDFEMLSIMIAILSIVVKLLLEIIKNEKK